MIVITFHIVEYFLVHGFFSLIWSFSTLIFVFPILLIYFNFCVIFLLIHRVGVRGFSQHELHSRIQPSLRERGLNPWPQPQPKSRLRLAYAKWGMPYHFPKGKERFGSKVVSITQSRPTQWQLGHARQIILPKESRGQSNLTLSPRLEKKQES